MGFNFFLDGVDVEYFKRKWENCLSKYFKEEEFLGVTTNPLAMKRDNFLSLEDWSKRTRELCEFVSSVKRNTTLGIVYVQLPSDDLTTEQVFSFAETIGNWGEGKTPVGLKIPPYKKYIELTAELQKIVDVNVTGLADCGTALKCCTIYSPQFISLIPGRMLGTGLINETTTLKHLIFTTQNKSPFTEVIAGSMRDVPWLCKSVIAGCVPTIGKTVLNLLNEENLLNLDLNIRTYSHLTNFFAEEYPPETNSASRTLSESFFKEMNDCGIKVKEDFLKLINEQ